MMIFDFQKHAPVGPGGELAVHAGDEVTLKLAMLYSGECTDLGPLQAAASFGFSKQRYFQLRHLFNERGAVALQNHSRGPKTHYRRTDELVRQVIRHRFLDPDASPDVIAQKLRQAGFVIGTRSVQRVIEEFGLQKNSIATVLKPNHLSKPNAPPHAPGPSLAILSASNAACVNSWPTRSAAIWSVSGSWSPNISVWEPGTCCKAGPDNPPNASSRVSPCSSCMKQPFVPPASANAAPLSQKGFELANGLPFLASDVAVHELLDEHTIAEAQDFQVALAKMRLASRHFAGRVLAVDPHRVRSHSKRQMRRHRPRATDQPTKVAQIFFVLDVDTHQPICLTTGTSARTVAKATPELLELTSQIFPLSTGHPLPRRCRTLQRRVARSLPPAAGVSSVGPDAATEDPGPGTQSPSAGTFQTTLGWLCHRQAALPAPTQPAWPLLSIHPTHRRNTPNLGIQSLPSWPPAMVTKLPPLPKPFPNAGTSKSSSMPSRPLAGIERERKISIFASGR